MLRPPLARIAAPAAAVVAAILVAVAGQASGDAGGPPTALYRGARLVDVSAGRLGPAVDILTEGERIVRIDAAGPSPPPPGARVVGVEGLFVSPGLINTHEHLATPPNRAFAESMMRKDLFGGVTAVRDMADDLRLVAELGRESRGAEIPGPDIVFAALMAGPAFFDDPRVAAVTAGVPPGSAPWMQPATSSTDLPLAVAQARGTGARAVKIYADLDGSLVAAITREAHRQGALVWAHGAVFPASPAQVIQAGVDSVSHVCLLAYQASDRVPGAYHGRPAVEADRVLGGDNPRLEALFQAMKARGVVLDATLFVYRTLEAEHARRPDGPAPYCSLDLAARLTRQAYRDGVSISAGTDGFSPATDPWPALQDELELLQDRAGMAPADVIRAATVVGARALGDEVDLGLVKVGGLADLVFTREDPLQDVRAFRTVALTVKRGRDYWRSDLASGGLAARGP